MQRNAENRLFTAGQRLEPATTEMASQFAGQQGVVVLGDEQDVVPIVATDHAGIIRDPR